MERAQAVIQGTVVDVTETPPRESEKQTQYKFPPRNKRKKVVLVEEGEQPQPVDALNIVVQV